MPKLLLNISKGEKEKILTTYIRIISLFIILTISFGLTSCFTGIESTKKISLSREDRRRSNPTPEEKVMMEVSASPLKEWNSGKNFIVSDDKALLVVVPREGLVSSPPESVKGKTLHFTGIDSKINVAGDITVSLIFSDGIYTYVYDTSKEFDNAMETFMSNQIPMLIDEDMVDQTRKLLMGKKYWTKSPLWYDKDENRIDGLRFVEVEIIGVEPGNLVFPLRLQIKTPDDQVAYMYMNFGNEDNESRAFQNLFSLTDPKKHYPEIDSETWSMISQGKVKLGMTKEECKLALGNPSELSSGHDYSQTLDIWSYDNGRVLWFEDGRLTKIRQ